MSRLLPPLVVGATLAAACGSGTAPDRPREPWVDRPVADWPDFALTNDIRFTDTTYRGVANALLVDTGADTVGVTVKHVFLALERWRDGVTGIALGDDFVQWRFRSSRDPGRVVVAGRLVNADPDERIGDFSGLKDRDWLVFEIGVVPDGAYPLKLRLEPLASGEVVRAVGRSRAARDDPDPGAVPLRHYRSASNYYYVRPADAGADPEATSGSPVIDGDGYLVGIVSGAVGSLGVVCGAGYLRQVFDRHGIPYDPGGAGSP
ncbi:MAG: trypsin-like peptidase domain-containing protein [Gemmatimonadota bacterium]